MRRTLIIVCIAITGLGGVFAESDETGTNMVPAAREIDEILDGAGDLLLANLAVEDLLYVVNLTSLAYQQQDYVQKSARLSRMVPGLGQYMNGNTGTAFGFFAADLAIKATVLVLGYLLLPASVQHSNLNYLQTPVADIEARWKALTTGELLPSVALAASGSILSAIVRQFASRDARDLAMQSIEEGTVVFQPTPLLSRPATGRRNRL